jgi:hypothetical protein
MSERHPARSETADTRTTSTSTMNHSAFGVRTRAALLLAALSMGMGAGCGSSPPANGAGGSGGGGAGGSGGGTPSTSPDAASPSPGPTPDGPVASGPLTTYQTCKDSDRVGDFELTLADNVIDVEPSTSLPPSQVFDWVEPARQSLLVREVGGCRIMQPPKPTPPCDPECPGARPICTPTGCRANPVAVDVGAVSIEGLKAPGTASKSDVHTYTLSSLPHPGFDEGASIVLRAAGAGGYGPFTARGWGVASLEVPAEKLRVERGKPATLTWTPPAKMGPTRMLLNFSLNRHGAVDTWLECEVPDTGSFTIETAVVDALFGFGISGFPSVDMKRQSSDTATLRTGCFEFNVVSPAYREIEVPGLISCSGEEPEPGQPPPCPPGQRCGDDLRCQ